MSPSCIIPGEPTWSKGVRSVQPTHAGTDSHSPHGSLVLADSEDPWICIRWEELKGELCSSYFTQKVL